MTDEQSSAERPESPIAGVFALMRQFNDELRGAADAQAKKMAAFARGIKPDK